MGDEFDRLTKAIEFERTRSRMSIPSAKPLRRLLDEESPHLASKDGTRYAVDRRDLDRVTSLLSDEEQRDVTLPIYLRPSPGLGRGLYQLLGVGTGSEMERMHSKIVFGLLGTAPHAYLYNWEVQRLKREMPSLIQVLY